MVIAKSHPNHKILQIRSRGHLGDGDSVVRALLVPQAANKLPVSGVGADGGLADGALDRLLQVGVRAPAGGVWFLYVSQPFCIYPNYLDQLTSLGGAASGLEGSRELGLSALGELGERVVVLGDDSDEGDGEGEEGLELHFGGLGVLVFDWIGGGVVW